MGCKQSCLESVDLSQVVMLNLKSSAGVGDATQYAVMEVVCQPRAPNEARWPPCVSQVCWGMASETSELAEARHQPDEDEGQGARPDADAKQDRQVLSWRQPVADLHGEGELG